jgi:predicted small integral membrane protein
MSTSFLIRLSKALLSLSVGLLTGLVALNNLIDYRSNFQFVAHILRMDTIFPESKLSKRAINSPGFHHFTYLLIILVEGAVAWLCSAGGVAMWRARKADAATFHAAKRMTIAGLLSGLLLWFTSFQAVAGEWFGMWMSTQWNGMASAARLTQIMSALLVFVSMKNDE